MKKEKKKKLPLVTVLAATILAIGLILFIGAYSGKGVFSQINIWGIRESIIESDEKDTDNDGLKDWQEELFKTDSLNPDTDGDGYLDGEEVDSGHNPLIKAPGDKIAFYPLPIGDRYNITARVLSEETIDSIIDSYLSQKTEYILDHPEITSPEEYLSTVEDSTLEKMSLRAVEDAYSVILRKSHEIADEIPELFKIDITDEDIKISEDNNTESVNFYISEVSSFLSSDNFFLQQENLEAVLSAFEQADFSKIESLIKINDSKIEKIKQITVPSSWKEIHKQGLKLTLKIRNIFVSFRDIQDDPLKAYIATEELEGFADQWNELIKQAIDLAEKQGIELSIK